ncbi:MAG: hypothetical protein KKH61_20450, partial [Gammaproteobacteria bacterium]|nr:hypothetical protein [Gammaproteobacteria bacterium]
MKKLILLSLIILMSGCAASIRDLTADYQESSSAVREFATITAEDWKLGTGIILGAIDKSLLPSWVEEEILAMNAKIDAGPLNDFDLGYMVGLRLRLGSPILKAAIEQYAPGILGIKEVASVLSFLGG